MKKINKHTVSNICMVLLFSVMTTLVIFIVVALFGMIHSYIPFLWLLIIPVAVIVTYLWEW